MCAAGLETLCRVEGSSQLQQAAHVSQELRESPCGFGSVEVVGDLMSCFIGTIRVSLRKRKEKSKAANIDSHFMEFCLKRKRKKGGGELDRKEIEIVFTEL